MVQGMASVKLQRGKGQLPVYVQVCEALRRDIQLYYKSGDLLPSESELSSVYQVNRHTLRRAIDELVRDGMVVRQHGKGMFVLAPLIEYPIASRTRLTETLESQGVTATSRIIHQEIITASPRVANALSIKEGDPVIHMETLRETESRPFCVCAHYLPEASFPDLVEEYIGGSLHDYLELRYGLQLSRTESMITAVSPQSDDLELLKMPPQLPILRVKSINVEKNSGQPYEYVVTRFRSDLAQLVVNP